VQVVSTLETCRMIRRKSAEREDRKRAARGQSDAVESDVWSDRALQEP